MSLDRKSSSRAGGKDGPQPPNRRSSSSGAQFHGLGRPTARSFHPSLFHDHTLLGAAVAAPFSAAINPANQRSQGREIGLNHRCLKLTVLEDPFDVEAVGGAGLVVGALLEVRGQLPGSEVVHCARMVLRD